MHMQYTSPPFAAGDYVKLLNNGSLIAEGQVISIEPLRTVIETEEGGTLYIANSMIVKWMILNMSVKEQLSSSDTQI